MKVDYNYWTITTTNRIYLINDVLLHQVTSNWLTVQNILATEKQLKSAYKKVHVEICQSPLKDDDDETASQTEGLRRPERSLAKGGRMQPEGGPE